MPDILEVQNEVAQYILGAQVSFTVYERISREGITPCPQVNLYVTRDEQVHHYYIGFSPESWSDVTAEFIGRYFRDECGWFL
jgi:hypothetical protein